MAGRAPDHGALERPVAIIAATFPLLTRITGTDVTGTSDRPES
jgi:hypothetical protein